MVDYQFNPLDTLVEVFNFLYPHIHATIVFVEGMHEEQQMWSAILEEDEVPAKILIDTEVPVGNVTQELSEQLALLVGSQEDDPSHDDLEDIANYIYLRYQQYVTSFVNNSENQVLH